MRRLRHARAAARRDRARYRQSAFWQGGLDLLEELLEQAEGLAAQLSS